MARHLITSALPYINGVKHLGNLVGSMLPADVYARALRAQGEEVVFICATDEHGTPAELAARAAEQTVETFCAEQHEVQRELAERFGLSWDWFGRTSRIQNHELTQHFARVLTEAGLTEVRVTSQVYSIDDQRFLPDRYVVGTCPNCGYERARGDQCENCTKPLDPTDLIDPRSAVSNSTALEVRESAHLFLLQSKMADHLRQWIDQRDGWPTLVTSIAHKWLDEGLEDRGITRDLEWGVPVPADEFPELDGKVFYVWFDAPIGYIAATKEWSDADPDERDWQSWWRSDHGSGDVIYTQFMAKDNIPFHTLSFPATLLGSAEPWKLVDRLKGFNWLNYYGGKFSTSEGRGVFMDDALELLGADYWRWYLIANAPESDDSTFTWQLFGEAVNKDLVATLGNFVNRTASQVTRHFGESVPVGGVAGDPEIGLVERVRALLFEYIDNLNRLEYRKASASLRAIWTEGNVYLEEREPWRSIKTDQAEAAMTLRTALGLFRVFAVAAEPILPSTSGVLGGVLPTHPIDGLALAPALADEILALDQGVPFEAPGLLFNKLDDDLLAEWEQRFGGA
jgi:methionyl-tRNA synthetase